MRGHDRAAVLLEFGSYFVPLPLILLGLVAVGPRPAAVLFLLPLAILVVRAGLVGIPSGGVGRRAFLIDYCAYAVVPVLVMAAIPHLPDPPDPFTNWLLGLTMLFPLSRSVYVLVLTPLLARRTPPARG